ncbi:cell cycle progression protein 1 isoform X2 [Lissotriton helveticus]
MSGNSSDSESSCGWTLINNEGSDIETLNSEHEPSRDPVADENPASLEDVEEHGESVQLRALCSEDAKPPSFEPTPSSLDEVKLVEEKLPDESLCIGTTSDDSDIVTLEAPKVEEVGSQEFDDAVDEKADDSEDLNLGSSSSSQYAFSQPETVFPSRQTSDESSNDEVSDSSGPTPRKRRAKRRTVSGSEPEVRPAVEVVPLQKAPSTKLGSSLNGCIVLALVIAVSMGFGHFYGTIQIREHQKYVEKILAEELSDMKDDLHQCQKEQETSGGLKVESEKHVTCLEVHDDEKLSFPDLKINQAANNLDLRQSLENGENVFGTNKLLKPVINLRNEDTNVESILTENQKLKEQLEGEKLFSHTVLRQKETLITETHLLKRELDKERSNIQALKDELNEYSYMQSFRNKDYVKSLTDDQEMETMQKRLKELEKKLTFEQQRSDLWERLYIEARENKGKRENTKSKKKSKHSFFGSVKDTFDAMKNSTKEFVRHHKEKIKQAKQAVKEKLKKFSDSVKSTFRHFKDSTKVMFDGHQNKRKDDTNKEKTANAKPDFKDFQAYHHTDDSKFSDESSETTKTQSKGSRHKHSKKCNHDQECEKRPHLNPQGCSGVFECAHQESISFFNKVLDPIKVDEFTYLVQSYLQQEVADFHHWKELEKFIKSFFNNGLFIHDRMLFTDFVNDLEQYLGDIEEYQRSRVGIFEDLDEYVYSYFFGETYSAPYGPSQAEARSPFKNTEGPVHEKQGQGKYHQRPRNKRDGKWHKDGRTNGRHTANLEIELGPLPFDPKY